MLTRRLLRVLLLAGLVAPSCAFALGVGQLEVRSALNQSFEAELPLIVNNPAELTGLTVRVPRQEDFDRVGIERQEFFSKLRFSVQNPPGGRTVVRVTSQEPIRDPNFNLLLELVWPRGRLIREFPIQLDPELYANRQVPPPPPPPIVLPKPVTAPPVATTTPPPPRPQLQLPPAPPVSFEGASFYGPVRPGETLAAIANRVRPSTAISLPQMMSILMAGNPGAFAGANPSSLRTGTTLKVPTPQALGVQASASPPASAPPVVTPPAIAAVDATPPPGSTAPSAAAQPGARVAPPSEPPPSVVPPVVAPTSPSAPVGEGSSPPLPPPSEPLREIVPRGAVPSETAPPAVAPPVAVTPPPPQTAAPPAASPAASPPVTPPVAAKPPSAPTADEEISWTSNPIVWLAIALIVLAIGAVVLLPLLRRPARPKPVMAEAVTSTSAEPVSARNGSAAVSASDTQVREIRSARSRPVSGLAAAPAALAGVETAPAFASSSVPPKPIADILVKDFDSRLLADGEPSRVAASQDPTLEREFKEPSLDAEPPTASGVRRAADAFGELPTESFVKPERPPATPERMDLPSELRLDGLDFDLGEFGLAKAAQSQSSELPPLEMKPAGLEGRKPFQSPLLDLGMAEPATQPPSLKPLSATLEGPAPQDLKFEFADVTQEVARQNAQQDSLKLDEALHGLGGELKLESKRLETGGIADAGGMDIADYVETKLDLASAYLDMGDQVGARGLLEEVLREGSATQKGRAEDLLKNLG